MTASQQVAARARRAGGTAPGGRRDWARAAGRVVGFGLTGAAITANLSCASGPAPPDAGSYVQQVEQARQAKDRNFLTAPDSPIAPAVRATFSGLPYYPVDATWRVPASLTLEPSAAPVILELPTSQALRRRMRRVGTLGFVVQQQPLRLTAFADVDGRAVTRLFVPFGDRTNDTATYKGGRYLDLDRTSTGLYDLDFNRAYHPLCVYDASFDCPVPPRENRLPIAVTAGERLAIQ
jgi:hypothetical protein